MMMKDENCFVKIKIEFDKKKFPNIMEKYEIILLDFVDKTKSEKNRKIYKQFSAVVHDLIKNRPDKIKKIEIRHDELKTFLDEFYTIAHPMIALYLEDLVPVAFQLKKN